MKRWISYMRREKITLKIRSLTKKPKEKTVLMDVNLDIHSGSVFGLIGPSDLGKSTFLKIMAGVMKPDLGRICIDDERVFDNPRVKRDILLISDDPFHFFNTTLKDMKEFYRAWYPNLNDEIYEKHRTILKPDKNKTLKNFSKGMKCQSFIVLALAISPKYLFLDEAFGGLDPVMWPTFKRVISEMVEKKEMTVIISSHNLYELEDIYDTFGILEDNTIRIAGYVDETKENTHKIQFAFEEEKCEDDFKALDLLSMYVQSRVANLVVKGGIEKIKNYLNMMGPLTMEVLNVNLEEVLIYEMEKKGYGVYDE